MPRGLLVRLGLILASLLVSVWILLPTILGPAYHERLDDYARRMAMEDPPEPETPDPWWVHALPNLVVNLGLDLQGGIDLNLQVEVDEAVLSTVQRDAAQLRALAEKQSVKLDEVRRDRAAPDLLIDAADGTTLDQVNRLMRGYFQQYQYARSESLEGRDWMRFSMTEPAQAAIKQRSVEQALETIRNRVDETGVKEPSITRKGEDGIDIQLPGETDEKQAIEVIGTTAKLEFMLVDEEADMAAVSAGLTAAKAALPGDAYLDDEGLHEWLLANGHIRHGQRLMWEYEKGADTKMARARPVVVKDEVLLTGDDVDDAQTANNSQTGEYYVQLQFKPRGSTVFADITGKNVGKRFAIVLDGQVRSAPSIRERIAGTASIQMGESNIDQQLKQASMLALVLRTGSLPAPVSVGESRKVGASLGDRAIREGAYAAGLGSALVLLFAGVYYRRAGLVADLSLLLNGILVVAALAAVGATLTLPGICGIALTIGMAVDCNIIIYERIREELRDGKGAAAAIGAGFDHAFRAVFDSNITTLLAGIVLYSYGTGPLRGFAVTLMIGIFTTLFTGVFVSRALMEWLNSGRRTGVVSI
jgi:protein-export membrane protein SecD